jgi:Protein of unknown function (DUF3775)
MNLAKEKVLKIISLSQKGQALRNYIDSLSDVEKQELTALTWYGGDYFFELDTALQESKRIPPNLTADYLASKSPLHPFLLNALEKVEPVG